MLRSPYTVDLSLVNKSTLRVLVSILRRKVTVSMNEKKGNEMSKKRVLGIVPVFSNVRIMRFELSNGPHNANSRLVEMAVSDCGCVLSYCGRQIIRSSIE